MDIKELPLRSFCPLPLTIDRLQCSQPPGVAISKNFGLPPAPSTGGGRGQPHNFFITHLLLTTAVSRFSLLTSSTLSILSTSFFLPGQLVNLLTGQLYCTSHHNLVPPLSGPFSVLMALSTPLGLVKYSSGGMLIRRTNTVVEILPALLLITTGNSLG